MKHFDVVIVGGGISGSIVAKALTKAGKTVLLLEAGSSKTGMTREGYQAYLHHYYEAWNKIPDSPYPNNPNAPQQNLLSIEDLNEPSYFVQMGPTPFFSDYVRSLGGTSLHWLGTSLRMMPNDFKLRTLYGHGVDWPVSYDQLKPYYARGEWELGVSAEVEEQAYLGISFEKDYHYPMRKIPQSRMDELVREGLAGMKMRVGDHDYPVEVMSLPQARNSTPNGNYQPVGAVFDPHVGLRCEGHSSCIPICPIQAKYNSLKTLASADQKKLEVRTQCVASKIEIDPDSGRVRGITYQEYKDPHSPEFSLHTAKGTIYVVAAHAVETAKLLLASEAANSSGAVGRYLMDHPFMQTWGLLPEKAGTFRGPSVTSGVESLRDGAFRRERAAFRMDIANWGWGITTGSPYTDVITLVSQQNFFGSRLRKHLNHTIQRQLRFGFLIEPLPTACNRVTIDPDYRDQLGNFRPVVYNSVPSYTQAGAVAAKAFSDLAFARLGVEDNTSYDPGDSGYFTWGDQGYTLKGSGHIAGTHRMGSSKHDSVVNWRQQTWDHENLYLVGCGNMPTIATPNPTLTMAALSFWAADNILEDLR
jgi:choline dehydrogenase-like flavoprotein